MAGHCHGNLSTSTMGRVGSPDDRAHLSPASIFWPRHSARHLAIPALQLALPRRREVAGGARSRRFVRDHLTLGLKFQPGFARRLRHIAPGASAQWHLDEMAVRIRGEQMYFWRAVEEKAKSST